MRGVEAGRRTDLDGLLVDVDDPASDSPGGRREVDRVSNREPRPSKKIHHPEVSRNRDHCRWAGSAREHSEVEIGARISHLYRHALPHGETATRTSRTGRATRSGQNPSCTRRAPRPTHRSVSLPAGSATQPRGAPRYVGPGPSSRCRSDGARGGSVPRERHLATTAATSTQPSGAPVSVTSSTTAIPISMTAPRAMRITQVLRSRRTRRGGTSRLASTPRRRERSPTSSRSSSGP